MKNDVKKKEIKPIEELVDLPVGKISAKTEKEKLKPVTDLPTYAIKYNKLKALFGNDKELDISDVDDKEHSCTIRSKNYHKLEALSKVLVLDDELTINLEYLGDDCAYLRTIADVFEGNKHFDNIRVAEEAETGVKHVITTFTDETIQYNADSRFVPGGYETTLAEKLVGDLFREEYQRSVYITKKKDSAIPYMDMFKYCSPITCSTLTSRALTD